MQNESTDWNDAGACVGHRNHALGESAHWRHLAKTIKRSVRGNDAALCQITLNAWSGLPLLLLLFSHDEDDDSFL